MRPLMQVEWASSEAMGLQLGFQKTGLKMLHFLPSVGQEESLALYIALGLCLGFEATAIFEDTEPLELF